MRISDWSSDVCSSDLIPIARLERQWPGGPVIGRFAARYGPDNRLIGTFALRVGSSAGVPDMMDKAVARMDQLYTQALVDGTLRPDPSLVIEEPVDPEELEAQETGEEMAVEEIGRASGREEVCQYG